MIVLKRAYESAAKSDGKRFLVERLWPRGVKKTDLPLDGWLKEIAPSTVLRTWYSHDVGKWPEFQKRYRAELRAHPEPLTSLRAASRRGRVTLVYAAHDSEHNSAKVLQSVLQR